MKIGTYKIKRNYKRKNKYNKLYKGKLTKKQKNINENRAIMTIAVVCVSAITYAFIMTSNNFTIINDETVHASSIVVSHLGDGVVELPASPNEIDFSNIPFMSRDNKKEYVLSEVKKAGLNITIAEKIIFCESSWNSEAVGINRNGTNDAGLWQINSIHKLSVADRTDIKKSTEWAIKRRLEKGDWRDWYSSRKCWNK